MTTTEENADDTAFVVTNRDLQAIKRAFGGMPYSGALLMVAAPRQIDSAAELIETLNSFSSVLTGVADHNNRTEEELTRLRRLLGNARELFQVLNVRHECVCGYVAQSEEALVSHIVGRLAARPVDHSGHDHAKKLS